MMIKSMMILMGYNKRTRCTNLRETSIIYRMSCEKWGSWLGEDWRKLSMSCYVVRFMLQIAIITSVILISIICIYIIP